jgi:NAD(P)-dependent dehydrogenase (short-subunit alcohol dehydrogenase family)
LEFPTHQSTNNKCLILTGATGKLGRVFAKYFLSEGHSVVVISHNAEKLRDFAKDFSQFGTLGLCEANLTDKDAVTIICAELSQREIYPEILINNARSREFLMIPPSGQVPREQWLDEYLLDVVIPYELTTGLSSMPNSCLENVVNVGSIYGVVAAQQALYDDPKTESPMHYGTAKAALLHLTKELSVRLAPKIRVNCISYGGVEGRTSEDFQKRYARFCPLRRMMREDEVIGPMAFLCSKSSSYLTGANLIVDGGWTVW